MIEQVLEDSSFCAFCPKLCRDVCPAAYSLPREDNTPWARMYALYLLGRNLIDWDEDISESLYRCINCMRCTTSCEHHIDCVTNFIAGRQEVVLRGMIPKHIEEMKDNILIHGSPTGSDNLSIIKRYIDNIYLAPGFKAVIFPGCYVLEKEPDIIQPLIDILEAVFKVDFVGIFPEKLQCCGHLLEVSGFFREAETHKSKLINMFSSYRTVVTLCSECTYFLRKILPANRIEVLHITSFLYKYIDRIDPGLRSEGIYYHDPCYLARYLTITEQPREILKVLGFHVLDFPENREDAPCCGNGTYYRYTKGVEEKRRVIAKWRLGTHDLSLPVATSCLACRDAFRTVGAKAYTVVELLINRLVQI